MSETLGELAYHMASIIPDESRASSLWYLEHVQSEGISPAMHSQIMMLWPMSSFVWYGSFRFHAGHFTRGGQGGPVG